ncbi:hypothetical protein ADICYQ_0707 [Cyclobacterium qasimii M12-11B]|uniref:Uncharacterized protein n=1 Tax=Cyclobacterium qasimii M12-11B TaxID=641524 RepID=S7VMD9_9BACT|nr:hypothetical protein ADICYQ_0707 [Cyclobacterium qasimii M12-11B]
MSPYIYAKNSAHGYPGRKVKSIHPLTRFIKIMFGLNYK